MNNQEMGNIKKLSTKTFYDMTKYLYVAGMLIYKEQGDYELVASIMLDNNRTESYLSHVKEHLAKRFDRYMEEAGKRERLIYVDMDKVILEMKSVHIKALLFGMN